MEMQTGEITVAINVVIPPKAGIAVAVPLTIPKDSVCSSWFV